MPFEKAEEQSLDFHERRLVSLESRTSEVASQLASQSVQIDGLGRTIEIGIETLAQKFDDFAKPVTTQLQTVEDLVSEHARHLTDIKNAEKAKLEVALERKKFWKNVLKAISIATGSLVAKQLFQWLWGPVGLGQHIKHFLGY